MIDNDLLVKTKHDLLLNSSDIAVLTKYDINCDEFTTIAELTYAINDILNNEDLTDDEYNDLDYIITKLEERNYYLNTNK